MEVSQVFASPPIASDSYVAFPQRQKLTAWRTKWPERVKATLVPLQRRSNQGYWALEQKGLLQVSLIVAQAFVRASAKG